MEKLGGDLGGMGAAGAGFDLFGDPIPVNRGRKGRPEHVPTKENRGFVTLLLATNHEPVAIAKALDISMPTLRKHYFSELERRATARLRVKGKLLVKWMEQALAGNVGAAKLVAAELGKAELGASPDAQRHRPAKSAPIGKKEQERQAAYGAGEGSGWGELVRH